MMPTFDANLAQALARTRKPTHAGYRQPQVYLPI